MVLKYKVLYVDDEQDNLFAFRSVFRRFFKVFTAIGAREAIDLLSKESVDLVLSDQRMPHMSGVELCEYVMNNYPEAERMIVTGYSDKAPIEEAMKHGMISNLITKPWNVEELKALIENALQQKE